uniref:Uncharacterized protein n=1 Tax=Tetraselmis chuii TaxID=63592 RepID=A0A6U1HPT3_9CHLO|mmetsp:Transcript_27651/g.49341  ORF Transcript_27651/g.49341 Transcript_27651/m.49341 type:complete len:307 (+) Transcript_27651:94-1014(+)
MNALRAARSGATDLYALLVYGAAARLPDDALRRVLFLEVSTLCLLWTGIVAYCRVRRRRLRAAARLVDPELEVTPLLHLRNGSLARRHREWPHNVKLYRGGRWLAVVSFACAYYPLYQPSFPSYFAYAFGGPCRDDACTASCRTGRKTLLGMCTLTVLLILYATWVRQSRQRESMINMAIKMLLSLPGLLGSILAPCWNGRGNEVLKPSPGVNAIKVLVFVFNLDVLLPSGITWTVAAALYHTVSMSIAVMYFLPEYLQQDLGTVYWLTSSWLPVAHITSLTLLFSYHRESAQMSAFVSSAQRRTE